MTPIKIYGFNNSIACGAEHSIVLTDVGNVYSCGQLGVHNRPNQNTLQIIFLNNDQITKSISCGYAHSLLLTTDCDIYSLGYNNYWQIGIGKQLTNWVP